MSKQILIVDDEEDTLTIFSRALAKAGYEVATAKNGHEALRRILGDPPDLVLLDLILPEMDGFAISETIKSDAALRAIPVVMISAWTDANAVLETQSRRAGAAELLMKPITPKDLVTTVKKYLDNDPIPLSA